MEKLFKAAIKKRVNVNSYEKDKLNALVFDKNKVFYKVEWCNLHDSEKIWHSYRCQTIEKALNWLAPEKYSNLYSTCDTRILCYYELNGSRKLFLEGYPVVNKMVKKENFKFVNFSFLPFLGTYCIQLFSWNEKALLGFLNNDYLFSLDIIFIHFIYNKKPPIWNEC